MASFVIANSAYHGSALLELSAPDPLLLCCCESSKACLRVLPPATSVCLAPPNHSSYLAMFSN